MPKPHPESIRPLVESYGQRGIAHHELVVVGDSVHSDLAVARAAGIDFVAVTCGTNSRAEFIAAGVDERLILDSIADLPALLGI